MIPELKPPEIKAVSLLALRQQAIATFPRRSSLAPEFGQSQSNECPTLVQSSPQQARKSIQIPTIFGIGLQRNKNLQSWEG